MSLKYIREYYGFTGRRGDTCKVVGGKSGVITGSDGQYVRVRLQNEKKSRIYHPSDIMFERNSESGLTQRATDGANPPGKKCEHGRYGACVECGTNKPPLSASMVKMYGNGSTQ